MNKNNFGALLCSRRKELGLNQKDIAEKLHVSDKAVSRWETGKSLPDIDMMCRISKIFDIPINTAIRCKIGESTNENIEAIVAELEISNKRNKIKRLKILIVSTVTILFLCLIIFFTNTYNKIKVYDIAITGDEFYSTYGVFINTHVQDILYLGRIHLIDEVDPMSTTLDIIIKNGDKETILQHYDTIYRNIEFDLVDSYQDIDELEDYFDNLYIRIYAKTKSGKETIMRGKINFVLRFQNSKLFYLTDEYKKDRDISNKSIEHLVSNLEKLGFIESEGNIFLNNEKNIMYLVNEKQLKYEYEDKLKINYKYVYYHNINKIHVLIVDKNNKVEYTIEEYTYDIANNKVDCSVGKCQSYKEILKELNPYIKKLF